MLTFKEALCLLAIAIAYGITGRMDYEDALLLEQARQRVGLACATPGEAGAPPAEAALRARGDAAHPPGGPRADVACAASPL